MPETVVIQYSDPLGIYEPATVYALDSNVRFGKLAVSQSAELGQASISTIELDDPDGDLNIVGLRAIVVKETSAPVNDQVIFRGVIQDRVYRRSAERSLLTGADRLVAVDATDYNWHLGSRRFVDADADRPAETPGDRIRWLLTNADHITLFDYGHVTYPTTPLLEATDYRTQTPMDLLADCCVEGQYNFWCDVNEEYGRAELFFIDPDSSDYASSLKVSNDIADIDSTVTFAPYEDAELRRSPSRLAFGVMVAYPKGWVYERNDTVGLQFGYIDQVAPMTNVKSEARARRLAQTFLAKNDEESDRLAFSIKVPSVSVNGIRAGHLLEVKFTHLPGYEAFRNVRVLRRDVVQEDEGGEDYYLVKIEAVPVESPPAVRWLFFETYGTSRTEFDVQASDDGVNWTTVATGAELEAGTTDPPDSSPGVVDGLVAVPEADWTHRYWRLSHVYVFGGGVLFATGVRMLRLLSESGSGAVCRLGTPNEGGLWPWWVPLIGDACGTGGESACFTNDVPFTAWTDGTNGLYGGLVSGDTCPLSEIDQGSSYVARQGCKYGLKSGATPAGTITTHWTWDLLG